MTSPFSMYNGSKWIFAEISDTFSYQGKEVRSLLRAKVAGPWTGKVLAKVSEWALDHPDGSKDDCGAWLKEEHAAGRIVITDKSTASKPPAKEVKTGNVETVT